MTIIRASSAILQLARSQRLHSQPFSSYAICARRKPNHPHVLTSPLISKIHTSNERSVDGPSRYGTAKEPPPHLKEEDLVKEALEEHDEHEEEDHGLPPTSPSPAESKAKAAAAAAAATATIKAPKQLEQQSAAKTPTEDRKEQQDEQKPTTKRERDTSSHIDPEKPIILPEPENVVETEVNTISDSAGPSPPQSSLNRVLDLQTPFIPPEEDKPPHLQAPRYVHHFDTYSLVRELQKCGFTEEQATSMMKAVRGILADHIDLARKALVSKSNVENETYLFRAACSELKTEIQNNRKAEADTWRSQRAQQQHEVDIVTQKMTQDLGHLKDELKGKFDDRKMAVRMEEKNVESKIQTLNYKITRMLGSDSRALVEGVRWVIIRQVSIAVLAILVTCVCIFAYTKRQAAFEEAQKKAREREAHVDLNVEEKIKTGAVQGLSEEALLAVDGVSGG